jgi:hypothetical protein
MSWPIVKTRKDSEAEINLGAQSLRDIERLWRNGEIEIEVVKQYIELWNGNGNKFTVARIIGDRIVNDLK